MTNGTARLDRMIEGTHAKSKCGESMNLPLVNEYRAGYVRCVHQIEERFSNSSGAVFGGYLSALLDDVTGHAAMTILPDDKTSSTAELSVSYFRPCFATEGAVLLEAEVINQSRRSYHIEATIKRQDGKLIAKASAVYALSDRSQSERGAAKP
jgi:uncharacterized protein (TIGR00369 family)